MNTEALKFGGFLLLVLAVIFTTYKTMQYQRDTYYYDIVQYSPNGSEIATYRAPDFVQWNDGIEFYDELTQSHVYLYGTFKAARHRRAEK